MTTVAWLFVYAGLLGWGADRLFARATWGSSAPRAALYLWHAAALGVVLAIGWALTLLAHDVMEHGFSFLLRADKTRLHLAYAPETEVPGYWNATLAVLVIGIAALVLAAMRRVRAERRAVALHNLVATERLELSDAAGSARIVGLCYSPTPLIYCLPQGVAPERIRLTTGALDVLPRDQVLAAIEHEHAHIEGRHHRQIMWAESVGASLRWTRLLRRYPEAVRELVEFAADDQAARAHGPRTVASALLAMCTANSAPQTPGAIPWTGGQPAQRIRRLLANSPGRRHGAASRLASVLAVALPVVPTVAAVSPALALANTAPHAVSSHDIPEPSTDFDHHP